MDLRCVEGSVAKRKARAGAAVRVQTLGTKRCDRSEASRESVQVRPAGQVKSSARAQ